MNRALNFLLEHSDPKVIVVYPEGQLREADIPKELKYKFVLTEDTPEKLAGYFAERYLFILVGKIKNRTMIEKIYPEADIWQI